MTRQIWRTKTHHKDPSLAWVYFIKLLLLSSSLSLIINHFIIIIIIIIIIILFRSY